MRVEFDCELFESIRGGASRVSQISFLASSLRSIATRNLSVVAVQLFRDERVRNILHHLIEVELYESPAVEQNNLSLVRTVKSQDLWR